MRFPRQSHVVSHMNGSHSGPRCLFLLITPHLRQVLCYIFNGTARLFIPHLAFLHTLKSSVRDDKLQFGGRSSEILTRASSKPLYQLLSDVFMNQWDGADSGETECAVAERLACWPVQRFSLIFMFTPCFTVVSPDVTSLSSWF